MMSMTMNRPETTLFMLMSVDGKISTGDSDDLDFDKDLPRIVGGEEGLHQYYELERQTDLFSLNTGRVMEKIGMNNEVEEPKRLPVSFVILDNEPHLTKNGVINLTKKVKKLFIVTTNDKHPALEERLEDLTVLLEPGDYRLEALFEKLKNDYEVDAMTVQSGGTLNAALFKANLIDHLSIVVAPLIVGGKTTPTLVDGEAIHSLADLKNLVPLRLVNVEQLADSYLHLRYDVLR
jgi:2,5-diamino-6-(ribosylamino)-4(3H)-pyrimidinone 5'-phosphate reductase